MYLGGTYLAVIADHCSPFLSAGHYNYSSWGLNWTVISILPKDILRSWNQNSLVAPMGGVRLPEQTIGWQSTIALRRARNLFCIDSPLQ
jgi:hypothetical protein